MLNEKRRCTKYSRSLKVEKLIDAKMEKMICLIHQLSDLYAVNAAVN